MSRFAKGKNNGKEGWYQGRKGSFGSLQFNYDQSHNRGRNFGNASHDSSKIWNLSLDDFPSVYIHNRNKHFH